MISQTKPWVPLGHFYSPILDATDRHVRKAMDEEAFPSVTAGSLGLDEHQMLSWFRIISKHYNTNPFPDQASNTARYYYNNPQFPLADALALLCIMVEHKPKRYVEVGCGYSSCAAIDVNEKYLGGQVDMTFIDPYPDTFLSLITDSRHADRLYRLKLQDVPLETFTRLESGDILFIDSSHVAKTGSDVLDYFFRILPVLSSGVLIHIHDIFFPFEYPAAWIVDENRSWNEAYMLRAFLSFNPAFNVFYFSDWIYKCRCELLEQFMPLCVQNRGGSIWIQKRSSAAGMPYY